MAAKVKWIAFLAVSTALAADPVSELKRDVLAGKMQLEYDSANGYLRSVLNALHVPVESQMLVFSKTSIQAMRIGPEHPRALYFNDSVVVGWVHGGFLELAAQDPQKGMMFYSVDQRPFLHEAVFQQRQDCLHCHANGTLVQSVHPASDGIPLRQFPRLDTDHRTPFEQLWGGWYVSGESGAARHMGSSIYGQFDPSAYPAPASDIVALMVFEHQMHMMNLLAAARLRDVASELADYMLFLDEPPLKNRIQGASGFAAKFASQGPLRQLDLEHRLMRYPCSYMIYSEAFNALPAQTKAGIYSRMWRVLSGAEDRGMSPDDRRAVVEILRETKPDLPTYFR